MTGPSLSMMSLPPVKKRLQRARPQQVQQQHQQEQDDEMPYVIRDFTVQRIERPKISAPVLLATTNVHTFTAIRLEEARRIRKVSSLSSNSSTGSASDASSTRSRSTSVTTASSAGTSPQSSLPSSPSSLSDKEKFSPVPSSQASIQSGPRRAASSADVRSRAPSFATNPLIPKRAPSHSKVAHENVARLRMQTWQDQSLHQPVDAASSTTSSVAPSLTSASSATSSPEQKSPPVIPDTPSLTSVLDFGAIAKPLQQVPPAPTKASLPAAPATTNIIASAPTTTTTTSTVTTPSTTASSHHPFGAELEQLDEAAEEISGAVRDAEREQDGIVMSSRRLHKFTAAEYLADLSPIFSRFFGPMMPARVVSKVPDGWI